LELVRIEFEELKREMGRKLKKLGLGVLLLSMAATLGLFLLGTGWLALAFYRELHKGGITRHTVERHSHTSTPHTLG
jgi:hypothetical protein